MDGYITIKDLAGEFKLDKSTFLRYVKKAGFSPAKIRTPTSRGQLTSALTLEEAETIRELREREGFTFTSSCNNGEGFLYIVQLVPELDPERIKIGFAGDVDARLSTYRTSNPNAKAMKTWPCKRGWERTAADCLTQAHCSKIGTEVFECSDLQALIAQGDAFFSLMPKVK
jgi:hypothetical protein